MCSPITTSLKMSRLILLLIVAIIACGLVSAVSVDVNVNVHAPSKHHNNEHHHSEHHPEHHSEHHSEEEYLHNYVPQPIEEEPEHEGESTPVVGASDPIADSTKKTTKPVVKKPVVKKPVVKKPVVKKPVTKPTSKPAPKKPSNPDYLEVNEALSSGDCIYSTNDKYHFCVGHDGDLTLWQDTEALWESGTNSKGTAAGPYTLTLQSDNDLVLRDKKGATIWDTKTANKGAVNSSKLTMEDNGEVELTTSKGTAYVIKPITDSLYSGETLYAGQCLHSTNGKYAACLSTSGNFAVFEGKKTLYSPKVSKKPKGPYTAIMESSNNFIVVGDKGQELWSTDTKKGKSSTSNRATMNNDGDFVIYIDNKSEYSSKAEAAKLYAEEHPRIEHGSGTHYGIDVSSYQSVTDHAAAVNHLKSMGGGATPFCFVKVSEGASGGTWSESSYHIEEFNKAGCLTGAYHFFHAYDNVDEQYSNLMSHKGSAKYIMLDIELNEAGVPGVAKPLIAKLRNAGIKPLMYSSESLVAEWGAESWGVPIWIAAYGSRPTVNAELWQYADNGSVPGVSSVDMDKSICSEAKFEEIFYA